MISNQPQTAPADRPPETRTPLNAVFNRLSNRPVPAAAEPPPPPPTPVPRPTSSPGTPPPAAAIDAEPPPDPGRLDPRVSFAAAVLARAGAAIAARAARNSEIAGAGTPASAAPPSAAAPQPPEPYSVPEPIEPSAEPIFSEAGVPASQAPTPAEPQPKPEPEPQTNPEPQAESESEAELEPMMAASPEPVLPAPAPPPREQEPALPKGAARTPAAATPVPAWLVAPVLQIAIPNSPFGRGNPGRVADQAQAPPPVELDTFGFVGIEPLASAAAPSAALGEIVEPAAAAPADTEPQAATEPVGILPADAADTPETQTEPPRDATPRLAVEAAEPASPAEAPLSAPPPLESVAASTAMEAAEPGSPAGAPAPVPLPRTARPLGAPQDAAWPDASVGNPSATEDVPTGLPAVDLPPVIVEPEADPSAAADTAVGPRRDDRPTMHNRRLYRRVGVEAEFDIDGAAAKLLDLSMGGFGAANAPALAPNAIVPVTVRLAIDGVDISTRMRARMIYAGAPRSGGRFIDLTPSQTAFLRYVVTWRGQSVGELGTATLLEAITRTPERFRPAAATALEPPGQAERRTSWWSRWFGWLRARGAPE